MPDAATLLAAYDAQLRTDAETPSALAVTRVGPLRLVTFAGGRGFVTYRTLDDADGTPVDAVRVRELVAAAADHFRADPAFAQAEWKTRGHDHAPGLHDALLEHGFEPEEQESIMLGEAAGLVADVPLPAGVTLRRVTEEADVRAMARMVDEVFGDPRDVEPILARLRNESAREDGMQVWVAEADGVIVSAGRLEPVPSTEFAGIWGGATRPEWRGQGIYRALTSARAREALRLGRRYLHSDSTEYSRPILERSGLLRASTTTPYVWHR
ncbi:GNAT family N-acetyltransferase [Xylanimonas protaetiae]|uniref:N-acetyltransferase n=1 Tax=Xylanimonas protaetiae TaxID=2509457 RepID=A0A4P6F2F5_9MICO|nr:GNAT family N-acetyltransferase [Xylanimonas protaetiae]QAY69684.1 N-acetyltransferase [Xylanimonas protaetiae]